MLKEVALLCEDLQHQSGKELEKSLRKGSAFLEHVTLSDREYELLEARWKEAYERYEKEQCSSQRISPPSWVVNSLSQILRRLRTCVLPSGSGLTKSKPGAKEISR